jgi:hypothetical protein
MDDPESTVAAARLSRIKNFGNHLGLLTHLIFGAYHLRLAVQVLALERKTPPPGGV